MSRELEAGVLLIVGIAVGRLALEGGYLAFVKPGMRLPLLVTGLLVIVLALAALRTPTDAQDAQDAHRPPRVGLLLLLPVVVLVAVAPPPLGASALDSRSTGTVQEHVALGLEPLPETHGAPIELTLSEFTVRTHAEGPASVAGRQVRLRGFIARSEDGTRVQVARFAVACCAADASPRRIDLETSTSLATDTWVNLVVRWNGQRSSDPAGTPVVQIIDLEIIEQPDWPYEPAAF